MKTDTTNPNTNVSLAPSQDEITRIRQALSEDYKPARPIHDALMTFRESIKGARERGVPDAEIAKRIKSAAADQSKLKEVTATHIGRFRREVFINARKTKRAKKPKVTSPGVVANSGNVA